ncbi:hypothetical protein FB45DRAFT_273783 [Roridomyces roridus]|uniref:F-box domain-containing protein n=1 Tax=Roridomyces roridus TaxID=1738132 RepID=A0AAD7FD89_9AGAR|nr:hypothetical protein FB45DRAFT_273783 [Roridomyces roridus]
MLGTALRARLSQIEAHIDALDSQLCVLRAERITVAAELAGIVYPVLSLPNEITSEIFAHYVDDSNTHSPMRLTWTCKLWREVAISTCRLWTCFRSHSVSLLPSWLLRAGHLTLDLHIPHRSRPEAQVVTALLHRYSTRVRTLDVSVPLIRPAHTSVTLDGPFPSLESLCVDDEKGLTPPSSPLDAPRLREVTFGEFPLTRWRDSLPWTQITKLQLGTDVLNCLEVLSWTPHLENLSFDTTWESWAWLPSTVTLPRLRTIDFKSHDCTSLLGYIIAPALEDLTMVLDSDATEDSHILSELIERSGCTLRTLNLHLWLVVAKGRLDSVLEHVPLQSLRELTLREPYGGENALEELLHFLTPGDLLNPPLPSLESLAIEGCQFHIRLDLVVDMLDSWMNESDKLRKFRLDFGTLWGTDAREDAEIFYQGEGSGIDAALDRLRDLHARGLEVDIQSTVKWSTGSVIEALRGGDCLI